MSIQNTMHIAFASLGLFALVSTAIVANILTRHAETIIVKTTATALPFLPSPSIAHISSGPQHVAKRTATVVHHIARTSMHDIASGSRGFIQRVATVSTVKISKPPATATPIAHAVAVQKATRLAQASAVPSPPLRSRTADVTPQIVDFYAIPHSIYAGQNVTLCIHVMNASHVHVINFPHPWHVASDALNCRHTAPKTTTRYTAWVTGIHSIKIRRRLVVKVFHASWMLARVHRFQDDLEKFNPTRSQEKE